MKGENSVQEDDENENLKLPLESLLILRIIKTKSAPAMLLRISTS